MASVTAVRYDSFIMSPPDEPPPPGGDVAGLDADQTLAAAEAAEIAPAELGAALRLSPGAATALVADALDLRHRLPRLWARVAAGDAAAWAARRVAQAVRPYS